MQDLWMGGGGPLDPPLVYWLGWIDTVGKLALPIPPQSLRPRCAPAHAPQTDVQMLSILGAKRCSSSVCPKCLLP